MKEKELREAINNLLEENGYCMDKEKSTLQCIVFKEVKKGVEWSDFGLVSGWWVTENSEIKKVGDIVNNELNCNVFPSKEEAEACLALSQLCQWRNKYNGDWVADWADGETKKYCIIQAVDIMVDTYYKSRKVLSFKSAEIRDKFLEDFRELIEQAKPLL